MAIIIYSSGSKRWKKNDVPDLLESWHLQVKNTNIYPMNCFLNYPLSYFIVTPRTLTYDYLFTHTFILLKVDVYM